MNLKQLNKKPSKKQIVDKKVVDSERQTLDDLLSIGCNAIDIVKELDQYFKADQITEFVKHYKNIYDITDDAVHPVFAEAMIEGNKEKIDRYKDNLELLISENAEDIRPADVVIAFDDYLSDYDRLRVISEVQDKLGVKGDFRSLHTLARSAGGYDKIIPILHDIDIDDIVKEQVVVDLLMTANQITDSTEGVEDPGNLDERAQKVEKYTANLYDLITDKVADSESIIKTVDECCSDKVAEISESISQVFDQPESLDNTILDYVRHQNLDLDEVVTELNGILAPEDKLVVVDTLLLG